MKRLRQRTSLHDDNARFGVFHCIPVRLGNAGPGAKDSLRKSMSYPFGNRPRRPMAVSSELAGLRRAIDELRSVVGSVRSRYGDIPAVRRLVGDVERIELDASELSELAPPAGPAQEAEVHVLDDTPLDPSLWADADDEGVGGYHGGAGR
jgi:hypothetical protein